MAGQHRRTFGGETDLKLFSSRLALCLAKLVIQNVDPQWRRFAAPNVSAGIKKLILIQYWAAWRSFV